MLVSYLNFKERWYFFKRRMQLFNFFMFAHHPLCKNYYSEVIFVNKLAFCRGCTEVYISTLIIVVLSFVINPFKQQPALNIFFIVLIITIPTWVAAIHPFNQRLYKDIARISLGIAFGIALSKLVLSSSWIEKGGIIIAILSIYYIFKKTRYYTQKNAKQNLCEGCVEFTSNICPLYKKQFEAERQYSRELSDFLQKKLSWESIKTQIVKKTHD